jgi:hypothetical protein
MQAIWKKRKPDSLTLGLIPLTDTGHLEEEEAKFSNIRLISQTKVATYF